VNDDWFPFILYTLIAALLLGLAIPLIVLLWRLALA